MHRTKADKQRVIELHLQIKGDKEITKITGFSYCYVQKITTLYWIEKMNNKL